MLQRLNLIFYLEDLLIGPDFTRIEITNLVPGTLRRRRRSGKGTTHDPHRLLIAPPQEAISL
jgi:hypothetical protein